MGMHHFVKDVCIENGKLLLTVDGKVLEKPLHELSRRLAEASSAELGQFEISPSGYGIHWPLIDEDLSIDGLLGISHTPE